VEAWQAFRRPRFHKGRGGGGNGAKSCDLLGFARGIPQDGDDDDEDLRLERVSVCILSMTSHLDKSDSDLTSQPNRQPRHSSPRCRVTPILREPGKASLRAITADASRIGHNIIIASSLNRGTFGSLVRLITDLERSAGLPRVGIRPHPAVCAHTVYYALLASFDRHGRQSNFGSS
jgi:hypothetical protein